MEDMVKSMTVTPQLKLTKKTNKLIVDETTILTCIPSLWRSLDEARAKIITKISRAMTI